MSPKFYLTTPIYYANARPHVGSTYSTIVCDTIARYKRMRGYEVAFLTGTDEHGENIERAAAKLGTTPREHVERLSGIFRNLWKQLDLPVTHFVRTTSPEHARGVQMLLRKARDAGYIYKGKYQGRYCIYDNLYVTDSTDPVDCPTCGRPAELVTEENYFFKLSAFADRLMGLYEKKPEFVQPDFRRNEVVSFVKSGLRDISVSRRSVKWGIPWPDDPEHVVYVWYDALTSYMTGVGYGNDGLQWEKWWPADLHLIGKEIIRFHCVYWPAFLMAAGKPEADLLPKQIFAHGWLLFDQQKMSKSKGNVAYAEPIAEVLGIDALRYYLLRDVVFGQDGNFSHDALLTRYNSDLANGLGNLASRTIAMIQQNCGGNIPKASGATEALDQQLESAASNVIRDSLGQYDRYEFSRALEGIWGLISDVDKYIVVNKPWKLASDETQRDRLNTVLWTTAESLRVAVALAHPILPHATEKIWRQLGQRGPLASFRLDELKWGQLQPGTPTGEVGAVFPRIKKDEAIERIDAMEQDIRNESSGKPAEPAAAAPVAAAPVSAKITIEDFTKVEMRVGEVKSAEKVAGADRLLKVMVDIGEEVRQIVAGIALAYTPEQLVGRKVVVVTNLAPRKLRGVESNGMIVAASVGPEGKPVLAGFSEDVPVGTRLK
ncbi:MAG: methionine--tRNA ligase [Acidobacteria bacterium]|nr:methionine--tRNA ligase [Acidobacteriota bacterium]